MYRFEWNYSEIQDEKTFQRLIKDIKNSNNGVNYEQVARLFYDNENGGCIMIELQAPTKDMIDLTEEDETLWMDGYRIKHIEDYNASDEIYTGIGNGEKIDFNNAEKLMLKLAEELCSIKR